MIARRLPGEVMTFGGPVVARVIVRTLAGVESDRRCAGSASTVIPPCAWHRNLASYNNRLEWNSAIE